MAVVSKSPSSEGAVGDVGERVLVDRIIAACQPIGDPVTVGPGDDAAVLRSSDGTVVVSTDMAIEGRHFRRDWSTAADIGHRVAAANCADIAAMGATPTGLVVALGLPADVEVSWVEELIGGLVAEAALAGASVVGGDVSSADSVIVSVTAIGELQNRAAVLRSGAQVDDVVAVAGRLGWAAAGWAVLSRGFRSPRALVDAYRRPEPPYPAGIAAAQAGAHAMLDVSDGLLLDAERLALASGVGIDFDTALVAIDEPVASAAAAYNLDPLQWILGGGDDHALLATFPAGTPLPPPFVAIGRVVAGDPVGHVRVNGRPAEVAPGFEHFRR